MFTKSTREVALNIICTINPKSRSFEAVTYKMAEEVLADEGDIYERDLYCLSNFSAFRMSWKGLTMDTSEHVYHWEKFNRDDDRCRGIQAAIASPDFVRSAHEAFVLAGREKEHRRRDWDDVTSNGRLVKVNVMKLILKEKVRQHEYVRQKLKQAHQRELIITERSWRDDFWGTGPDEHGKDWMGILWNEIAQEEFGS